MAVAHCVFVLLSGLFVILEAKSLFSIALIIHPLDEPAGRPSFKVKLMDTISCSVLAVLDLFICYMIKKIIFNANEGQQILVDRVSGDAYYIIKNIPHGGVRRASSQASDSASSSASFSRIDWESDEPLVLDVEET